MVCCLGTRNGYRPREESRERGVWQLGKTAVGRNADVARLEEVVPVKWIGGDTFFDDVEADGFGGHGREFIGDTSLMTS